VLDHQRTVLRTVVGYYRALADRGQIEISTTPFYHPILPLVHDNGARADVACRARRCRRPFAHPKTSRANALARDITRNCWRAPRGGVAIGRLGRPELIPILAGTRLRMVRHRRGNPLAQPRDIPR